MAYIIIDGKKYEVAGSSPAGDDHSSEDRALPNGSPNEKAPAFGPGLSLGRKCHDRHPPAAGKVAEAFSILVSG